jgi:hypothetical protein
MADGETSNGNEGNPRAPAHPIIVAFVDASTDTLNPVKRPTSPARQRLGPVGKTQNRSEEKCGRGERGSLDSSDDEELGSASDQACGDTRDVNRGNIDRCCDRAAVCELPPSSTTVSEVFQVLRTPFPQQRSVFRTRQSHTMPFHRIRHKHMKQMAAQIAQDSTGTLG